MIRREDIPIIVLCVLSCVVLAAFGATVIGWI
jgi:hypothetical protein